MCGMARVPDDDSTSAPILVSLRHDRRHKTCSAQSVTALIRLPSAEPRVSGRKLRAKGVGTLGALIDNYFSTGPGSKLRRSRQTSGIIKTVFGKVLRVQLAELTRAGLQLIADDWPSGQSAALAVRSLRPCLKWAERRELAPAGSSELEPPCQGP